MTFPFPYYHPLDAEVAITVSQIASTTSTAATITAPASINAGDLLVLWDFCVGFFATPPSTIPSGFNSVIDATATLGFSTYRALFSYKIADGTEDSASLTGSSGNSLTRKALIQFRGSPAITSATFLDTDSSIVSTNPTAQTVTAASGTPPLIVFGLYGANAAVNPRTFSPAKDSEVGTASNFSYLAWKIYNPGSTPADVSIDMDDESDNTLASCYCVIA